MSIQLHCHKTIIDFSNKNGNSRTTTSRIDNGCSTKTCDGIVKRSTTGDTPDRQFMMHGIRQFMNRSGCIKRMIIEWKKQLRLMEKKYDSKPMAQHL